MRTYGPKRVILERVNREGRVAPVEMNLMSLSEASLNKMMDHGKTGMVIISANRSAIESTNPEQDLTSEFENSLEPMGGVQGVDSDAMYDEMQKWLKWRNAHADKELKNDIHTAGFSYTPVFGGYHGSDDVVDSYEPSYVVYCYDRQGKPLNFQDLEDFAIEMCRKYKQDSVYVQRPGQPPVYLDADGNQVNTTSTNDFKFNRDDEEFFTTTSRDKSHPQRFTADIVFESMYIPLRPASYNESMRRIKSGEYIL